MSLGLFIFAAIFITPQTDYQHARISEEKYSEIIANRKESNKSLLQNLKFNDHKVYYAKKNNTWYYSMIENNKNAENPRIKTDGDGPLSISFKDSQDINQETIANATPLIFIAYNDNYYYEYKLAITTLPIISIEHDDEILKDDDVDMEFELFDNREKTLKRTTKTAGKIHIRGGSSASFEKKSYRLNLRYRSPGEHDRNANEPLLGMREDDDWILFSNYRDGEKIRQSFNSQLAKNSSGYGTENRFVEVINNSEYSGLYTLSTTIDEKTLGFQKDSNGNYTDFIFKKWDWQGTEEQTEDNEKMGYELKTDKVTSKNKAWDTLKRYLRHTEETFDYNYAIEHIDIDSAIDYTLLTELSANIDSINGDKYIKNVLYAFRNKKDKTIVSYIPWDFDITWGTGYIDINVTEDTSYRIPPNGYIDYSNTVIGKIAKENTEIYDKIMLRYKQLRDNAWSDERLNSLLNTYQKDVFNSGAFNRDKKRWNDGSYSKNGINYFRAYMQKRIEYMDYWFGLREDEPEPLDENWLNNEAN